MYILKAYTVHPLMKQEKTKRLKTEDRFKTGRSFEPNLQWNRRAIISFQGCTNL